MNSLRSIFPRLAAAPRSFPRVANWLASARRWDWLCAHAPRRYPVVRRVRLSFEELEVRLVPSTILSSSASAPVYGTDVDFTAAVSLRGEPATSGNVLFDFANGTSASVAVADGQAVYDPGVLNAGSYTLNATFDGDGSSDSLSQSVAPAALTITADDQSMTYGGSLPTFTATPAGLVNNDTFDSTTVSYSASGDSTSNVANAYTIMPSAWSSAAAGNYNITYVNGNLTINQASLTITADDQSMTYGGSLPTFTATPTGLVNNDTFDSTTVSYSASGDSTSNVGNAYTITPSAWSSAAAGNYAITYVNGNLTINQASLTITADDQSMTYGGSLPTFTATPTGLVNNDTFDSTTVSYSATGDSTSNVGGYAITPSAWSSAAAGNYAIRNCK